MRPHSKIEELTQLAQVQVPNDTVTIPATMWGTAEDITVEMRKFEDRPTELCVTFIAEGGYAGGRVRMADLLNIAAKYYPELVQQAQANAST